MSTKHQSRDASTKLFPLTVLVTVIAGVPLAATTFLIIMTTAYCGYNPLKLACRSEFLRLASIEVGIILMVVLLYGGFMSYFKHHGRTFDKGLATSQISLGMVAGIFLMGVLVVLYGSLSQIFTSQ